MRWVHLRSGCSGRGRGGRPPQGPAIPPSQTSDGRSGEGKREVEKEGDGDNYEYDDTNAP